jgi:GT2 family glycosyltransferase
MSAEPNAIRLNLLPPGGAAVSKSLDPSSERQRICFDDLQSGDDAIVLSLQQSSGQWRDGFIHLYRIQVTEEDTGNSVLACENSDEISEHCLLSDLRYRHSALGEVFVITGPEPRITVPVENTNDSGNLKCCIELSAPYSLDYAIAQDGFIREENNYINRIRDLEYELKEYKQYKSEIEDIKRSKAWRLIEGFRNLVYGKILGLVPVLRNSAINATRPGNEKLENRHIEGQENVYQYRFSEQEREQVRDEIPALKSKPLISIVMPVYNVDPTWLEKAIESVDRQLYENWELCIVDDASTSEETLAYLKSVKHPRIKIRYLDRNRNISAATNEAIRFASADYIAFMDNDDELTEDALFHVVREISESNPDMLYSDEDFIDIDGEYINPHFKPDFSPDLLLSHNYITHLVVVRKDLLTRVGMLNSRYDGAQDHELLLRLTEATDKIAHIPKVLYHWRMSETSTSMNSDVKPGALLAARMALKDTLKRRGIEGEVIDEKQPFFFRIKRKIEDVPLVSIVIPFRDKPDLLSLCVNSILDHSMYQNFEIVAVSNNSRSSETFSLIRALEEKSDRFRCIEFNEEFNFSRVVNFGVEQSAGDYLIILNNDIEVISWDWIEAMLEHAQRDEVGAVGAKLYYPNNTIQHAGIIIGLGGYAGHSHKQAKASSSGYFNRLQTIHNVSAVTGACLMISRAKYEDIGGFDEESFKIAYNDVDFCLRLREKGLLNVFTPYAELYHHESISRGYEDTEEKIERFSGEKERLRARHPEVFAHGDPYYNPNLTHDHEHYGLAERHYRD